MFQDGSIAAAVDASAPGDTVLVHQGVYPAVTLNKQFDGSPVRIVGATGATVIVGGFVIANGSGYTIARLQTNSQSLVQGSSHDVAFDHVQCTLPAPDTTLTDGATPPSCFSFRDSAYNLTVSNSSTRGGWDGVKIYSGNSIASGWVRNVTVVNNDISGAYEDDMHIDGADGMTVRHNFIHDPQANTLHNDGIQTQASNNLRITQNTFSFTTVAAGTNVGTALMLGNLPAQFPDRKVTNTLITNNLVAHWQPGRAVIMNGTENTHIINNTFFDNGDPTVNDPSITVANQGSGSGQNPGLQIWNNILKSVYYDPGSNPPAFFDTNLQTNPHPGASGTHVIRVNPRFVNRTSYALAPNSRARRHGLVRTDTPRVDIDGRGRAIPPGLGARR